MLKLNGVLEGASHREGKILIENEFLANFNARVRSKNTSEKKQQIKYRMR